LKFTPGANGNGAGYASFTFQVQDDGGTANGGVDLDPTPRIMTIDVTPVDDAPVIVQNTLTLNSGASAKLSPAQLSATDVDNPAAGLLFTVSAVTHGQFALSSVPAVAIVSFSQAQVVAGQVIFEHDGSSSAPSYAISVSDGTLSAGPAPASVSFSLRSTPASSPALNLAPPSGPALPSAPSAPTAPQPATVPSVSASSASSSSASSAAASDAGADRSGAHDSAHGAAAGIGLVGVLDNQSAGGRPTAVGVRGLVLAPLKLGSSLPEVRNATPQDLGLLIQGSDPQYPRFEGSAATDWSITSAFNDSSTYKPQKDQMTVLLESAQMGGIALSVGVVWWASRVTGVIGSLLASMPAWRHLDPLPVVGRDEKDPDGEWSEEDSSEADADELAISMVLDGPRSPAPIGA